MTNSAGRLEQSHKLDFTWDLDLDTNDTATHQVLPADPGFRGDWTLTGTSCKCDPPSATLSAVDAEGTLYSIRNPSWGNSVFGERIHFDITPRYLKTLGQLRPAVDPTSQRRFRVSFTIPGLAPAEFDTTRITRVIADRVTSSFASKRPNDVRLYFPRIEAELWSSASLLSAASSYLKTLLESDFAEGTRRKGKKRARVGDGVGAGGASPEQSDQDEGLVVLTKEDSSAVREGSAADNSDDETDELLKHWSPPSLEDDLDDGDFTYREIKITETAYSTYRAVLLYLHTSHIAFAPLSSTLLPLRPTAKKTRWQFVEAALLASPQRLPLVSPKAVYRLAHLLEIPSLLALALNEIKSQLSIDNAARELFSHTSALYDDVRAVLLEYVVAHWQEVRRSDGWREMDEEIKAGELPHAGAILLEVVGLVSK